MRSVATDSRWVEWVDPLSVTAQFPAIDDYAFGPQDPNPFGVQPPNGPVPPRPPGRVSHVGGAVAAAIVTVGIAVAANYGATALLIAVAAAQGLLILCWVFGTAVPGRLGALGVGALAAAGADIIVLRWPHGQLGTLAVILGLSIPAMFIHQLTRGVVRARVVESLSDVALMVVAVVAMAAFVQLRHEMIGDQMVTGVALAAGCALVSAHLVDMVWPVPRFDPNVRCGLLAVVVAAAVGASVTYLRLSDTVEFASQRSLYLGASVGAIVSLFAVGAAFVQYGLPRGGRIAATTRPVAGAFMSVGLLAPIGYLLCLIIRG
jgi:hypothetical protein